MSTDDLCQQFCECLGSDELRSRVYSIEGRVNLFLSTRSSHTAGSLIFHPNCSINIELIELIIDSARFHRHQRPTLERGLSIHPVTLLCCDVNVGKDWNLSHLDWVMGSCEKVGKQFNIKSLMHVHRWSDAILNFINSLCGFHTLQLPHACEGRVNNKKALITMRISIMEVYMGPCNFVVEKSICRASIFIFVAALDGRLNENWLFDFNMMLVPWKANNKLMHHGTPEAIFS